MTDYIKNRLKQLQLQMTKDAERVVLGKLGAQNDLRYDMQAILDLADMHEDSKKLTSP